MVGASERKLVVAPRVLEAIASFISTYWMLVKKSLLLLTSIQVGCHIKAKRTYFFIGSERDRRKESKFRIY